MNTRQIEEGGCLGADARVQASAFMKVDARDSRRVSEANFFNRAPVVRFRAFLHKDLSGVGLL